MSNFSRRKAIAIGTAGVAGIAATVANNSPVKAQTESLSQPPVNSNGRFANKVVLVTGATSGIGEATARTPIQYSESSPIIGFRDFSKAEISLAEYPKK